MQTKYVLIIVGITIIVGLSVAIPIVVYHEQNKPAAIETRKKEQRDKELAAEIVRKEEVNRRQKQELQEKLAKEEEARKKVIDESNKKYRGIAKEFGIESLMMSNLFLDGTSLAHWREQTKKTRVIAAKLADPETENNKLFYSQVDVINNKLAGIETIWNYEIEKYSDKKALREKMKNLALECKEKSKQLLTSIEQYKD